jgi:DNA (cytosine-5)-methyltransferase 3A
LYWVGKRNLDGSYSRVKVEQPEDRGILLRDVLDCVCDADCFGVGYRNRREADGKLYRRFETHGQTKANALTTVQTDSMVAEPCRVGALPRPNGELSTSQAFRVYSVDGKSVNITAGGGGAGGKTGLYAIPVKEDKFVCLGADSRNRIIAPYDGKTQPVYEVKDGQTTIKGKRYPIKLTDGFYIIRKLTVSECKRLQTVPEWYKFPVSDSQAYKMLGNGWTVAVIAHLIKATQSGRMEEKQLDLFQMVGV